ncbi:MAG: hypothetical protein ACODAD_03475, partial [Planctomycetota bacterium]
MLLSYRFEHANRNPFFPGACLLLVVQGKTRPSIARAHASLETNHACIYRSRMILSAASPTNGRTA